MNRQIAYNIKRKQLINSPLIKRKQICLTFLKEHKEEIPFIKAEQ